jgi:hypothetical protein
MLGRTLTFVDNTHGINTYYFRAVTSCPCQPPQIPTRATIQGYNHLPTQPIIYYTPIIHIILIQQKVNLTSN